METRSCEPDREPHQDERDDEGGSHLRVDAEEERQRHR